MSLPERCLDPGSIPLSLYIHFPWCVRKCPYCDFNSHQLNGSIDEKRYLAALKTDLAGDLQRYESAQTNRKLHSVFLGGGTPSLISAGIIAELLEFVGDTLDISADTEVTMEANPGTLEHHKFESFLEAGINRLSMGIQSFNDTSLRDLGRIHNATESRKAIRQAQSAGFRNINLDLMYGLPGQNSSEAVNEAAEAASFNTSHLSFYQLTLEPNTFFHKHPPKLPHDDSIMEMQEAIRSLLADAGYQRYEVSAFSKPGSRCRHNINYWSFGDYLGIGAGAHSKVTNGSGIYRDWKVKLPENYMSVMESGNTSSHLRQVENDSLLFEFMLNALRLREGFDLSDFESHTGLDRDIAIEALSSSLDQQLIVIRNDRMKCTRRGYLFIDEILQRLLP